MILIDAFPKTYFSNTYTPFLYNLSKKGTFAEIEPLFAFKGIETTTFTGHWPYVHNVWTEFRYIGNRTNTKKNRLLSKITKIVDFLPSDEHRGKLRYAIKRYFFRKPHATLDLIPSAAMTYFEPSQQKKITEPSAISNVRTVFDIFRKKGIEFTFIEPWIFGDSGVLHTAKKLIKQKRKFQFWYLKFNHLDHLGHKFGPMPFVFKENLMKVDLYVEHIVALLLQKNPNLSVLILTDHGMSKVHKSIDLMEDLCNLRSKMYKDYVAFLDSTMIRFWFLKKEAKQEICKYLQQIGCGHILTIAEKRLLKIPLDLSYGEIIFVLDEGYVVHPCYFHSKSMVSGMHGYAYPKTPEAIPILIINDEVAGNSQLNKRINYTDIAQLILHSLS